MIKKITKLSFIVIITLLLSFVASSPSFASSILWNQDVDMSATGDDVDSCIDFPAVLQVAADDWYCTDQSKSITGFNWWGTYLDYSGDTSVMNSSVTSFQFFIYEDDGTGQPGDVKKSQSFNLSNITESYVDVNPGTGNSVFKNSIMLDSAYVPVEGNTYWIAVYAFVSSSSSYTWAWNTSSDIYGNSAMVTDFSTWSSLGGGAPVNLAFELVTESEEVPEPATLILLGSLATGLFSAASIRKKFSK